MIKNLTQLTFMKTIKIIFFLAALFMIRAQGYAQNWELVWSDEFNYTGLPDGNKWSFDVHGPGWVNNERQNYTNRRLENARVENGKLILEARRDWFGGHEISSARLVSANKGDWTYGRMEVRAKLPAGRGTWPAIWMLPTDWTYGGWPASGEIDIMEYVGYQPDVVHSSVHTRDRNFMNRNNFTVTHNNNSVEEQFNNYVVEWRKDRLDFFVNNVKIGTYANTGGGWAVWPFDKRFHMILNLAIGGDWGGAQGIDNNIFPTRMEVEYVRVFKEGTSVTGDPNLAGTYRLQNRFSGLYMDVSGNSTNNDANIQQWTGNDCACQQFTFTHLGAGTYKIIAKHSGKSLDVAGFSTSDGGNVIQYPYNGTLNQQFVVKGTGDGYYKIIGKQSNKLVEVGGWSTVPGGNVQQWADANQSSGQWKLIPVTTGGGGFSTTIQAESYSAMLGVTKEGTTDNGGGENVGYIDAGDWMAYNNITIPASGAYTIEYRVASQSGGRLSADLNAGSIQLGAVNIPATGGWQNWTTVSHTVNMNAGTYNFGIFAQTGGWNINWFRIFRAGAAAARSNESNLLEMPTALESVEFYPNPAAAELFIKSSQDWTGGTAKIFDSMGIEVSSTLVEADKLDVASLETGIYTILITKDGKKVTKRFVKQ